MSEDVPAYEFHAPVLCLEEGMINHFLPIPDEIAAALAAAKVRRVVAVLNGRTHRRAVMNRADGTRMLILGEPLLRDIGARAGDRVEVCLWADPDPDRVELCDEFLEVLEQDAAAADRYYSLTPGMRRSLALYVNTAKREETRIKRSLELARKLRTHTLAGDRKAREE